MANRKGTVERVRGFVKDGKTIIFIKLEGDANEYGVDTYREQEMFQLALTNPGDHVFFHEYSSYLPFRRCEGFKNTTLSNE
jgi:hypothetical protein